MIPVLTEHAPKETPWGPAQSSKPIAAGVWWVSTAGHGGIWLSPKRAATVDPRLVAVSWLGSASWWEEDGDWALAALAHPTAFPDWDLHLAARTIRTHSGRAQIEAVIGDTETGREFKRRGDAWYETHADYLTLGCMSTSGHNWTGWAESLDGKHRYIFESADYPPFNKPFPLSALQACVLRIREEPITAR